MTTLVPEFDLADRMRKALRESTYTAGEMASYLGVNRTTVSTWLNGHYTPGVQTLRLWAMATGVPFEWLSEGRQAHELADLTSRFPDLRTGFTGHQDANGYESNEASPSDLDEAACAARDLNPQPADYWLRVA
jgi:transcriptional regulator with XRE-family HTH domain